MRGAALGRCRDRGACDLSVRDLGGAVRHRKRGIGAHETGDDGRRICRSDGDQSTCEAPRRQILNNRIFGCDGGNDAICGPRCRQRGDERRYERRMHELIRADDEQRPIVGVPSDEVRHALDHHHACRPDAPRDANRTLLRREAGDANIRQRIYSEDDRVELGQRALLLTERGERTLVTGFHRRQGAKAARTGETLTPPMT